MLIQVKYHNGHKDAVTPKWLDRMIAARKIKAFRRSSGWVILGVDPVRTKKSDNYQGTERRRKRDLFV